MMTFFYQMNFMVLSIIFVACQNQPKDITLHTPSVEFKNSEENFNDLEKELIIDIISDADSEVRKLMPDLPKRIKVILEIVDWDLDVVGGVTGRAESNKPPLVIIQVSQSFPGGSTAAIRAGLRSTIFHEFHHLAMGWAIQDNKFPEGIQTAIVMEGLADVFSEEYTGVIFKENQVPEGVNMEDWISEIMELPKDADYQKWMFQHPDGRTSIGYRAGNYLIKKTIKESGKSIVDLSNFSPKEILDMTDVH